MAIPKADAIPSAITHDNQTEGYYIVSGGGTAFIDGYVVNGRHSTANSDGGPNGPGCSGLAVGSRKVELKVGDVLIVPPGVIHGWADIPDHVDYLSFRPPHDCDEERLGEPHHRLEVTLSMFCRRGTTVRQRPQFQRGCV